MYHNRHVDIQPRRIMRCAETSYRMFCLCKSRSSDECAIPPPIARWRMLQAAKTMTCNESVSCVDLFAVLFDIFSRFSYGLLLHMASQIATAMNHFECAGLVHGDLAARNCLVTLQGAVKVCDLGRNQPRHPSDYCRWSPFAGLPVRWMACETLLHVSRQNYPRSFSNSMK
jgi:serine/threonine protein kinase